VNRCLPVLALVALAVATFGVAGPVEAATQPASGFHAHFRGTVIYYNPAGFEPDFDLISRVIVRTKVRPRFGPAFTLILDSYLESFQTDTQPVLPDLIHQKRLLSSTLGGFLSGKAIVVGRSNRVLFVGDMLAEALIKPICMINGKNPACKIETNHMIVNLVGQGAARGGSMRLKSVFTLNSKFDVAGVVYGDAHIPAAAQAVLRQGTGRLNIHQILHDFHVPRPYQRGTAGNGRPAGGTCIAGHCTNRSGVVGHRQKPSSGSGPLSGSHGTRSTSQPSARPAWMAPLGIALIVLALILLAFFFWDQLRARRARTDQASNAPT